MIASNHDTITHYANDGEMYGNNTVRHGGDAVRYGAYGKSGAMQAEMIADILT